MTTMAGTPTQTVLKALTDAGCNPRTSRPGQWEAKCPNSAAHKHGDRRPSLSVGESDQGNALIHCQTGCSVEDVTTALGLRVADLFPPPPPNGQTPKVVERYDYVDTDGRLLFQVERLDPKGFRQRRPDGNGGWVYNLRGVDLRPLYQLPQVLAAVAAGQPIWVCEGEKDVRALERAGHVATTCPGGAGKWRIEHTAALWDADVRIVADDDKPGWEHAETVATAVTSVARQIALHLPAEGHQDIAAHLGAGLTVDDLRPWPNRPPQPDHTDPPGNWQPADLAAVLAAGLKRPVPTVLRRDDGLALLYPAKINTIYGESGGGKTWVALIAVAQTVADGHHVIIIDWEDDAVTLLVRLQALGIPPELAINNITYYPVATGPAAEDLETIDQIIRERETALLVIDSTGEAMASQGLDQDRDMEAARWLAALPRRWARLGVCVLLLDHVPKHGDNRQEIGSQRKRAGLSGASYELVQVEPFAAGQPGRMTLKVGKDRGGNYARGTEQASIVVTPNDDGTRIDVTVGPGTGRAVGVKQVRSIADYEAAVLEYVTEHGPGVTVTTLRQGITGDNHGIDLGVKALVSRGLLDVRTVGRANLYSLTKHNEIQQDDVC